MSYPSDEPIITPDPQHPEEQPVVAETIEEERRSQIDHELPDEEGL